jgi:hypothetical protein
MFLPTNKIGYLSVCKYVGITSSPMMAFRDCSGQTKIFKHQAIQESSRTYMRSILISLVAFAADIYYFSPNPVICSE